MTDNSNPWVDRSDWQDEWIEKRKIPGGAPGLSRIVGRKSAPAQDFFLKEPKQKNSPKRRERLFREATTLFANRCPRIPILIESNSSHWRDKSVNAYFVSEYIEGKNLTKIIARGTLDISQAVEIAIKLLETLSCLHSNGVVHRDIKPDNLLIKGDGSLDPYLVDFGISFGEGTEPEHGTNPGETVGNKFLVLSELSPNSVDKRDPRSDLAFVAALMLYMITGETPGLLLDPNTNQYPHQREATRKKITESVQNGFVELMDFFDRAFQFRPANRFSSANAMRDTLVRLMAIIKGKKNTVGDASLAELRAALANKIDLNKEISKNLEVAGKALTKISSIASQIASGGDGVLYTYQSGHEQSNTGLSTSIGFQHPGDNSNIKTERVVISVEGDEVVVHVGGSFIYRTSLDEPKFEDPSFTEGVETVFLRRANEIFNK